jgi:hypothetical protein
MGFALLPFKSWEAGKAFAFFRPIALNRDRGEKIGCRKIKRAVLTRAIYLNVVLLQVSVGQSHSS